MFARSALRKVVPFASKIIKARSMQITNSSVGRFLCSDFKESSVAHLPNAESRRLYTQEAKPEPMIVDYQYVKKVAKDNSILLVDVREPDEVKEHGKIPNSINIPLGSVTSVLSSMTEKEFQQTYNRAKPHTSTEIIFYCMIGKRSGKAQQNAIDLGYKNTRNYLGSWTDWKNKDQ